MGQDCNIVAPTGQNFQPDSSLGTFSYTIVPFTAQNCVLTQTITYILLGADTDPNAKIHPYTSTIAFPGTTINYHNSKTDLNRIEFLDPVGNQRTSFAIEATAQPSGVKRQLCVEVRIDGQQTGSSCICRDDYKAPPVTTYPDLLLVNDASNSLTTLTIGANYDFDLTRPSCSYSISFTFELQVKIPATAPSWTSIATGVASPWSDIQVRPSDLLGAGLSIGAGVYRIKLTNISQVGIITPNPDQMESNGLSQIKFCSFTNVYTSAFTATAQQTEFVKEDYYNQTPSTVDIGLNLYSSPVTTCNGDIVQGLTPSPLPDGFTFDPLTGILTIDFNNVSLVSTSHPFTYQADLYGNIESHSFAISIIECASGAITPPTNIWQDTTAGSLTATNIRFLMNSGPKTLKFADYTQTANCGNLVYSRSITPTQSPSNIFLNPNSNPNGTGTADEVVVDTFDETVASMTYTLLLEVQNDYPASKLSQQLITIDFVNCDDFQPEVMATINPTWVYSETESTDKTYTIPGMQIPTSTGHDDICPVNNYSINSIETGLTLGSLAPTPAGFDSTHFAISLGGNPRTIITKWSGFSSNGGFGAKEGIYLFSGQACTSATQPASQCRQFSLRINVYKDCTGGAALGVTVTDQTDAHYTVNQGTLAVPIVAFLSSSPFSCKVSHYFWEEVDTVSPPSKAWPTDLVTLDTTDDTNLQLEVNTDDNRYAIVGQNVRQGTLYGKVSPTASAFWTAPLNLYIFYDCSSTHVPLDNLNSSVYLNQQVTVRVTDVITKTFRYPRVTPGNSPKNDPCMDQNNGQANYFLIQTGYTDGVTPDEYQPNLVTFSTPLPSALADFNALLTPLSNAEINTNTGCALTTLGQRDCTQDFSVEIRSYNGTISEIASASVKFESECLNFQDNLSVWVWPPTDKNFYLQGQRIGLPIDEKNFNLPKIVPTIGAITDLAAIEALCGGLEYQIHNTEISAMTMSQPLSFTSQPSMTVQTLDSSLVPNVVPYVRIYPLKLEATFSLFKSEGIWYQYDLQDPNGMDFPLSEPCYNIQYTDLVIWGDVPITMNAPPYKIQNPVKQPAIEFSIEFNYYQDFVGDSEKCGQILYSFLGSDDNKIIPLSPFGPVIEYQERYHPPTDSYQFELGSEDLDLVGNYTLYVTVFLPRNSQYPPKTFNVDFEIQPCILNSISPGLPLSDIVYIWGDAEKRFTFSKFNQQPACDYSFLYDVEVYSIKPGDMSLQTLGLEGDRAPFIKSFYQTRRFGIETMDEPFFNKTYEIYMTGEIYVDYPQYQTLHAKWNTPTVIEIGGVLVSIENSAPYASVFPDTLLMSAENSYSLQIPQMKDDEGDEWYVEDQQFLSDDPDIGSWASYDNNTRLCFFNPPLSSQGATVGVYVKVRDNNKKDSMASEYTFYASVLDELGNSDINIQVLEKKARTVKRGPPPNAEVKVKSTNGEIVINFDQLMLFDKNITSWSSQEENPNKNQFEIEIKWTSDMEVTKEDLKVDWKVTGTTPEQITIKLKFAQPKLISRRGYQDYLAVKALNLGQFVGANSKSAVKRLQQEVILPELSILSINEGNFSKMPGQTFAFSMKTIMQTNLILSIPIGGLLQYLWGMINSVQLIVLTVLFTVDMPVYSYDIYLALNQLVAFDIFQVEETVYEPYFNFPPRETLSPKYDEVGFDTPIYIIGMGSLFFIQLCWIPLNLGRLFLRAVYHKLPRNCRKKVRNQVNFKGAQEEAIRFSMEGCIEICINSYLTLVTLQPDYFTYRWEAFSSVVCIGSTLFMIGLPFYLFISAYTFTRDYKSRGAAYRRFFSIYKDFRPRIKPMLYYFVFIARRYIFVLSLLTLQEYAIVQTAIYLISSVLTLAYLMDAMPYREKFQNKYETASEMGVLLSGYSLLSCSNASDTGAKAIAGNNQLLVLGFIFGGNILLILSQVSKKTKLTFSRCLTYRNYRQRVKRKHQMKIEIELRFRGGQNANQTSKTRRADQLELMRHEQLVIENPFKQKGRGLDFFYDMDTKLTKRQVRKQEAIKQKELENEQNKRQLESGLDENPAEADFRDQQRNSRNGHGNRSNSEFNKNNPKDVLQDNFLFNPSQNGKIQDNLRQRNRQIEQIIQRQSKQNNANTQNNPYKNLKSNLKNVHSEERIKNDPLIYRQTQNDNQNYLQTSNYNMQSTENDLLDVDNFDDFLKIQEQNKQSYENFLKEKTQAFPDLENHNSPYNDPYDGAVNLKPLTKPKFNSFIDQKLIKNDQTKTSHSRNLSRHTSPFQAQNKVKLAPAALYTPPHRVDYNAILDQNALEMARKQAQLLGIDTIQPEQNMLNSATEIDQFSAKSRSTANKVELYRQSQLKKAAGMKQNSQQIPHRGGVDNFYRREFL